MEQQKRLHELRVRFIELNSEYTQQLRSGKTAAELKDLNLDIQKILAEIESLEKTT